jgi:hypothetical protein
MRRGTVTTLSQALSLQRVLTNPVSQRVALGWYKTGLRPEDSLPKPVAFLVPWQHAP